VSFSFKNVSITVKLATPSDNTYYSFCVYRRNIPEKINYDLTTSGNPKSTDTMYYLNGYWASGSTTTGTISVSSLGTIGGETVSAVYITFDFAQLSVQLPFNSSDYNNWYCRFSPNSAVTHGGAMKFLVKASGLDFNNASAGTADADLAENVSVTFPFDEAKEFSTYLEYAQYLTQSTLSLLRVNTSREIVYELIKKP